MLGQGVKRWHFMDLAMPYRGPPHRPLQGRHRLPLRRPSTGLPPPHSNSPALIERGTPPATKFGKCRPPVARGASMGCPLRPTLAGPSTPPCGSWKSLVFRVPLRLCWSLGRVIQNPESRILPLTPTLTPPPLPPPPPPLPLPLPLPSPYLPPVGPNLSHHKARVQAVGWTPIRDQ